MTDVATLAHELSAPLTVDEQQALGQHEQVIALGLKTFVDVGNALAAINESRLYRTTHQSFEAYAKDRWNLSRTRSYELMAAADVVSAIADTGQMPPENEAQARQLARLPETERAEVWRETVERTEGRPTAAAVREVSEEQQKRAAFQRDARAVLERALDLLVSPNRPDGHVEHWIKQMGSYDDELSLLVKRSTEAIAVLDQVVEEVGR